MGVFPGLSQEGVCPRHKQLRREYRSPRNGVRRRAVRRAARFAATRPRPLPGAQRPLSGVSIDLATDWRRRRGDGQRRATR